MLSDLTVHLCVLDLWPFFGRKKQNPRSGCRPGVFWKTSLVATLVSQAACGVSGAPVAKPIPKEIIRCRHKRLRTRQRGARGTGLQHGQEVEAGGHGILQSDGRTILQAFAAWQASRLKPLPHATRAVEGALAAMAYRLITSRKRGVALSSIFRLLKSNRLRSASCEGCTFCNARNMISTRPGLLRSHSCSISLTT